MKFTSAPKKMLLTGLSAAMVVAFAPGLAFGEVSQTDPTSSSVTQGDTSSVVATLTWTTDKGTKNAKTNSQDFRSDRATWDDDALQAALVTGAGKSGEKGVSDVKVTLKKSNVTFNGFTTAAAQVPGYTDSVTGQNTYLNAEGFVLGGKVTLDLNGGTIGTAQRNATPVVTLSDGSEPLTAASAGNARTETVPVYAQSYTDALNASGDTTGKVRKADGTVYGSAATDVKYWDSTVFQTGTTNTVGNNAAHDNKLADSDAYTFDANNGKFSKATDQTAAADKWYIWTVQYTPAVATVSTMPPAGDVSIVNGTVTPQAGQSAVDSKYGGSEYVDHDTAQTTVTVYATSDPSVAGFTGDVYTDGSDYANEAEEYALPEGAINAAYTEVADKTYDLDATDPEKPTIKEHTSADPQAPTSGAYKQFTLTYNAPKAVTSPQGAVSGRQLTLDAAKLSSNAADTVNDDQKKTDVVLQNGASVAASAAADDLGGYDLTAVEGGDVTIQQSDEEKGAKKSRYESSATVSSEITGAKAASFSKSGPSYEAFGIDAGGTVTASTTGDVTASVGRDDSGSYIKPGTGEETDGAEAEVSSTAVKAGDHFVLRYGNYKADKAADDGADGTGEVYYGTYDGYVDGDATIYGGRFLYRPDRDFGNRASGKNYYQYKNTLDSGTNVHVAQNSGEGGDGYWYAYRLGDAIVTPDEGVDSPVGGNGSQKAVSLAAPSDARDASGDAYSGVDDYVADRYLDGYTQAKAFAYATDANGQKVIDGNQSGTIDVRVSGSYLAPTDKAARAGKYETELGYLNAQATANRQTAQGIYRLAAQTEYYTSAKTTKIEDVATLGDNAKLAVTAGDVQTNADAKAYKLGETNVALEVSRPQAISGNPFGTATFQTADAGYYGITVTTTKDVQDKATADLEQAKKELQEAIDAANQASADAKAQAEQAVRDAQARVDAAQAEVDRAKAEAAKAQRQLADKKAADSAKAKKVSNVKGSSKAKKTARVSWSKVKGAVKYQVRYRVEHSDRTRDFRYKTVKASSKTVKALKSGKRYHFSVRVQTRAAGKAYWGKWSSSVCVKVK